MILTSIDMNELAHLIESAIQQALRKQESKEVESEWLNVKGTAELLGIEVPTLYSKNSKREIPSPFKAPGTKALMWKRQDIIDFIESGRQSGDLI